MQTIIAMLERTDLTVFRTRIPSRAATWSVLSGKARLRGIRQALVFGSLLLGAGPAFAHVNERGLVMLLPTGWYQAGAAIAVLASFLSLAVLPEALIRRLAEFHLALFPWRKGPRNCISVASAFFLFLLVVIGFRGTADPLENLLPLFIWTVWWGVLPLVQVLTGDLWPWLNPWTGPLFLLRRWTGTRLGRAPFVKLPSRIGYLPAITVFLGFAWYELISLSPQDPHQLAHVITAYWLATLAAMITFGEGAWTRRGEAFSIFFRLVGSLAPLRLVGGPPVPGQRRLVLAWPGIRCLSRPHLPPSGIFFVLLTLSSVSFDGLSSTFAYLGAIGINPLEFPGRSAVIGINTAGLLGVFATLSVVFLLAVNFGNRITRRGIPLAVAAGLLVYSIIPISIAFHASHYLMILLLNMQYVAASISDPFSRGWNLFGTANLRPTGSFANTLSSVELIWTLQTGIIVIGHVVGILLAHMLAVRLYGTSARAMASQIFLAAIMVFYTVFGLWLLSTPTS